MTERQAATIAGILNGVPQGKAALDAGYALSSAHVRASELVHSSKYAPLIAEARAKVLQSAVDAATFTAQGIVRDLHDTHREARSDRQYGPAVSALGRILEHIAPAEQKGTLEIIVRRGADVP